MVYCHARCSHSGRNRSMRCDYVGRACRFNQTKLALIPEFHICLRLTFPPCPVLHYSADLLSHINISFRLKRRKPECFKASPSISQFSTHANPWGFHLSHRLSRMHTSPTQAISVQGTPIVCPLLLILSNVGCGTARL
jgi:hypothetical protein